MKFSGFKFQVSVEAANLNAATSQSLRMGPETSDVTGRKALVIGARAQRLPARALLKGRSTRRHRSARMIASR
jgi:hypothetical protein